MLMKTMMAAAVLATAAAGPAMARGGPSDAYPVCLQVYGPVTYSECSYTSIPQCQASASGRPASCQVNPFFEASAPSRRRPY